MQILKELIDQLSILATLRIKKEPAPQNGQHDHHSKEQENYTRIIKELFPKRKNESRYVELYNQTVLLTENEETRNFRYKITTSDGSIIKLTHFAFLGQPFCKIILCQPGVWINPLENAKSILGFVEKIFGPISYYVATCDLAVHFTGWNFDENLRKHFGGQVKKRGVIDKDLCQSFSGFEAGTKGGKSRSPLMRLYCKTLQLRNNHGAPRPYFIYDQPFDEKTVIWNLEFSFNSRALRTFQINSIQNLESKIPELWKYATSKFIYVKSHQYKTKEFKRSEIMQEWKILQSCFSTSTIDAINRIFYTSKDISGYYKLNKLKKNLLAYALFHKLDQQFLNEILAHLEIKLLEPSTIKSLNWNDYVCRKSTKLPDEFQIRSLEI